MSEVERRDKRIAEMRKQGLVSRSLYLSEKGESASEEEIAREENMLLDAMEAGEGQPLHFNDSRKLEPLSEIERRRLLEGEWL